MLIQGGLVIDGTGAPAFRADVRVEGCRITEVGRDLPIGQSTILDAQGAYVTPGFIDCHTHFDASLFWDPRCDPMPEHGVTTVLIGNCSLGLAPVTASSRDEMADVFSYIEDIPRDLFSSMLPWDWGTYAEYVRTVSARHYGVNVLSLVPHSWLRTAVMGKDAWKRAASLCEAEAIAEQLKGALAAGALGMSTSLFDKDSSGRPVPSCRADDNELNLLFQALGNGGGIAQLIPRLPALPDVEEDLRRFGQFAGKHQVSILVNAITDPIFDPTAADHMLGLATELQIAGAPVYPMLSPRSVEILLNFHSTMVLHRIPAWNRFVLSSVEEKHRLLGDPAWRACAQDDWDNCTSALCPTKQLDSLRIVSTGAAPNLSCWTGRMFAELVAEQGGHPSDVLADWLVATGLDATFVYPLTNQRPDVVAKLLRDPAVIVGASDAGAHFQAFCGAGDTTLLLERHVRERRDLSVELAIHSITGRQADLLGLRDRGIVRPGAIADLAVFQLEELSWLPDQFVNDVPGGGARLRRPPGGYRCTIVNGVIVQTHGRPIDVLPGRYLGVCDQIRREARRNQRNARELPGRRPDLN